MNGKIGKLTYIVLFTILYVVVAGSSLWHAIDFFGLANSTFMSIILAFAFEVGQAAVLFALLTSDENKKKVMPWVLMTVFTLVQVLGNVYSSYKHIILNSVENLRFFKEPVFIWTTIPDEQATVIITYLCGGILPISSLLLTSMLTSYLSSSNNDSKEITNLSSSNNDSRQITEEPKTISHDAETPETSIINDKAPDESGNHQQLITDTAPSPINDDALKKTHMI